LDFGNTIDTTEEGGRIESRSSQAPLGAAGHDPTLRTFQTPSSPVKSEASDDETMEETDVAAVANEASSNRADEASSIAFAKLLQEQERAFYEASRSPGRNGGGNDQLADQSESLGASPDAVFRVPGGDGVALGDNNNENTSPEDPSLVLARQLMEEDTREWQHRMFALAGVDDDNGEGVDVDQMTYEELTELGETIGTQSKGLSIAGMATLRKKTYLVRSGKQSVGDCAMNENDDECDDEECAVCRCAFEENDDLFVLPRCGHEFHRECLAPWVENNKVCPLCKTEIEEEKEKEKK